MASTSRIKSAFTVAATSASKCACSCPSTKGVLNTQGSSSSVEPFSKWNSATLQSKPWSFSKHTARPHAGAFGPPQVDPRHLSAMDPLSKIREIEMELLKTRPSKSPSPLKLICLGGPGVGKGTYASLVSMRLGIPHISTGDLIRKELSKPPSLCSTTGELMLREVVRTAMNQGKLIGDDVIVKLLSNRLQHMDPDVGFILDGFPRTISQAHILDDAFGQVDMAINFHLEEEILVAKCLGRRVCNECGEDYNLAHVDSCTHEHSDKGLIKSKRVFLPARLPPAECASKLKVRGDDSNEAAVRERLELFMRESEPLEQHYRSQGKLVDLDVGPGAEYVWPRLLDAISEVEHKANYMASYGE